MSSLIDQFKDKLEASIADAQDQVGDFLKQKKRILALPQTLGKQILLDANAKIQERATGTIASAQSLKSRLESFDPMDFSKYSEVPSMTREAASVASELVRLRDAMVAHKQSVDSAAGSPQTNQSTAAKASSSILSSLGSAASAKAVGIMALVAVGVAAYRRRNK